MKNKKLFLSFVAFIAICGFVISMVFNNHTKNYQPRKAQDFYHQQGISGAIKWLNQIKGDPLTGKISDKDLLKARESVLSFIAQNKSKAALGIDWYEMGPDNVGGRTRAILIDKNNTDRIYAGGVAGGLWVSNTGGNTWNRVESIEDNVSVSCIAQSPSGVIYVGTGEGLAQPNGINFNSGQIGTGMYKSTDGITFISIASTIPSYSASGLDNIEWSTINRIACMPNSERVYVAYSNGLKYSDDQGVTWNYAKNIVGTNLITLIGRGTDIKIGSNGLIIYTQYVGNNGRLYISPTGDPNAFVNKTTGGVLPSFLPSNMGRIEVAVAPSNPNVLYASAAAVNGTLYNIYQSKDAGNSWSIICPGGNINVDIFRDQGWYDNVIAVYPNNSGHILVGGIDMWEGIEGAANQPFSWTRKTLWQIDPSSIFYVHADHHAYVFHPTNPSILYVGSDGGISKSTNGALTFFTMNRGYNVTQFYSVACSNDHRVMGGTQDNGTQYINRQGNTPQNAKHVMGGDGGYSEFSIINSKAMFKSTYYGRVERSPDNNASSEDYHRWYDWDMTTREDGIITDVNWTENEASFVTPILKWESLNDINSPDSVFFIAIDTVKVGQKVRAKSKNNRYPIPFISTTALSKGDTVKVHDVVQHKFFLGIQNMVWMTREALDFSKTPEWSKISLGLTGMVQTMAVSKDGDNLFVGTQEGRLYRISGLKYAKDSLNSDTRSTGCILTTTSIGTFSRAITSISVDWYNPNRVIVTLGNFGSHTSYISLSEDALAAVPTFSSKQGNMPKIPVYSSVFEMNHPNFVIVGTEYGIFTTDNISAANPVWTPENNGLGQVPVFMLRQQTMFAKQDTTTSLDLSGNIIYNIFPGVTNTGFIYMGTHGRGIFYNSKYYRAPDQESIQDNTFIANKPIITVYPNPVSSNANIAFSLKSTEKVNIRVYDLRGRIVKEMNLGSYAIGNHDVQFNCEDLTSGTYIVNLKAGDISTSSKFVVNK